MEYTYSFIVYPNDEQIVLIAKTFGCCRFIYNYFLDYSNNNGYSSKYTNNNIYNAPKELMNTYDKIGKLQKNLSLKKKDSNNYKKLENKINKLYD